MRQLQKKLKILSIFGTRPEAIKMAPVIKELDGCPHIKSVVCVTAQHRQMLDQVLHIFQIKPDYDLNIMKEKQSLTYLTTEIVSKLSPIIEDEKPDMILVHGDTTTTFAAALVAFNHKIRIGHVEAGLRTHLKYSPYPEEINRQLTSVLADLHFCPTAQTAEQLKSENAMRKHIFITGNTVIDALRNTVKENFSHPILDKISDKRYILLTVHRRENLGSSMQFIFQAIRRIVQNERDVHVVYPVHLNPNIQRQAQNILGSEERIHLMDPLDPIQFHNFASRAYLILTDSGGVQEEAPSFGVPVLVLRDTTERPEGINIGALKLVGTDEHKIYESTMCLLNNPVDYKQMAGKNNPYGDGKAAQRICQAILYYYEISSTSPSSFQY